MNAILWSVELRVMPAFLTNILIGPGSSTILAMPAWHLPKSDASQRWMEIPVSVRYIWAFAPLEM